MLRPYRPQDLQTIMEMANRGWRPINAAYRRAYGDELFDILFPTPDTRVGEAVKKDIEKNPGQTLVFEENGRVVGFIVYQFEADKEIGEVGYNGVDPDHQGKGIAQRMYEAVLDTFRQEGMRYAKVSTGLDEGHAPARRAYNRAGFDIQHQTVAYYKKL